MQPLKVASGIFASLYTYHRNLIIERSVPLPPKETLYPLRVDPDPAHSGPKPQAATNPRSGSTNLPTLDISYRWNQTRVAFWAWLPSPSVKVSGFAHVTAPVSAAILSTAEQDPTVRPRHPLLTHRRCTFGLAPGFRWLWRPTLR